MILKLKAHFHIIAGLFFIAFLTFYYGPLTPTKAALPSGLVGAWSFDENTGTTANDILGTTNGTIVGGATWVAGIYGTALSFDGSNDSVNFSNYTALNDLPNLTVTFWAKTSDINGYIVSKRGGTSGFWRLGGDATKDNMGLLLGASTQVLQVTSTINSFPPNTNTWTHVAFTWDRTINATSAKIYVNGIDKTNSGIAGIGSIPSDASSPFNIGSREGTSSFFNGSLDEVRVYNRILSLSEIQDDMNTPTDTTAPATPSGLSATAASSTIINLSWSATTDNVRVSAYKVYRGGIFLASTTATSYSDTGLNPSTNYSYTVSAYDQVLNESSESSGSNATTLAGPDTTAPTRSNGSPSGALSSGTTQATLSLSTSESATCKYGTTAGVAYSSIANTFSTTGGTSHSHPLTGLTDGSTYNYYIRCTDSASNINPDDYQISFSVPSPGQDLSGPVISLVSSGIPGINTATITWTTNEAADGQVEYGLTTYDFLSSIESTLSTNHSISLAGLKSDSTYNFRVKSKDSTGNITYSGNFTFTTVKAAGDVDPPVITGVSASVTYASATISWETDEPATSKVEYGVALNTSTTYTASTTRDVILKKNHSVTLKNLQSKTKYNFRVISDDVIDNRGISGNFTFTTDKIPATLVADPIITKTTVSAVRPTSAKIEWRTNIPATSQIIFGEKSEELNNSTLEATTLTTTHSLTVTDLVPKTKYFFRAVSRNAAETATSSEELTFQTPSIEIQQLVDVSRPDALPIGSSGTLTPKTTAGGTVTAVPILPTKNDTTPPDVILFDFLENPTENTSPTISGRAVDREGVIAAVAYSTDNGDSWHPTTQITGIGTGNSRFSATIPNLRDGNYPILFRVKDNSGNSGSSRILTLIIDERPPATGANALFLGTQSVVPSGLGAVSTLSGIINKIVTTAVGGVTSINVIATPQENSNVSSTFPLSYSKSADLWYGDIEIDTPGAYSLSLKATDGTGQFSLRAINPFAVGIPGAITDSKNKTPLKEALVSVYQFSKERNNFVLWPGEIYLQANPQITETDGTYRFILPPGKYYLKVERSGYQTLYTNITEFKNHSILALALPLKEKPYIKLGKKKLHFPAFPDFSGSKRVGEVPEIRVQELGTLQSLLNNPAPIFDLPDLNGNSVDLRYLRGKRTVLSVWSTWSPLAQAQVPILDEVQRLEGDEAAIVLISLQESEGAISTYFRRGGYDLTGIADQDGKFADLYPVLTLPQHFFIDRKGIIREIFVGFLDQETLLLKIRQL